LEYSDLDIVDRREIKNLDGENFWRYIGKSEVPLEEPGHLSPATVAKAIEYGVSLLGCFIEGYVGSNEALAKEADFGKMAEAALEFARGSFATCSEEHNWYEHFQLLMRHPVIKYRGTDRRLASLPVARGSPQYLIRSERRLLAGLGGSLKGCMRKTRTQSMIKDNREQKKIEESNVTSLLTRNSSWRTRA